MIHIISFLKKAINYLLIKLRLAEAVFYALTAKQIHYKFSFVDRVLYIVELFTKLPPLNYCGEQSDLKEYSIKGKHFFYPKSYSAKDLPWLFHEVFDDYNKNPSSYDSPLIRDNTYDWVIDAGACEGFFSIFAILNYKPKNLVVIEPDNKTLKSCEATINSFYNTQRNIFINCALYDADGTGYLIKDDRNSDFRIAKAASPTEGSLQHKITLRSIDSIISEYRITGKILIKMDIEDSEVEALKGAIESLKNCDINWCIAVYHSLENAKKCSDIIYSSCKHNNFNLMRGFYGYFKPARPYILFSTKK